MVRSSVFHCNYNSLLNMIVCFRETDLCTNKLKEFCNFGNISLCLSIARNVFDVFMFLG